MSLNSQISLKPTVSDVVRLNWWLDQNFAESGIEKSLAADLKLCINEVIANLISYGFKDTAEPLTLVEIRLERGSARATITDNGAYFDIREWQPPRNRDLLTAEPGGFGVMLIKERASRLDYTRVGELNRLEIVCEGASP